MDSKESHLKHKIVILNNFNNKINLRKKAEKNELYSIASLASLLPLYKTHFAVCEILRYRQLKDTHADTHAPPSVSLPDCEMFSISHGIFIDC